MPRTLVFATNNAHKLKEIRKIIPPGFQIEGLKDIGCEEDIPVEGGPLSQRPYHHPFNKDA